MIRKIVFLLVAGIFFGGCKSKKTVTSVTAPRPEKPKEITVAHEIEKVDDGLYVMPEDTGEFLSFDIGSPEEYIATFSEIAQMEMKAYGIPASITLAQGLLESGIGNGELARKTNNHFGIKCHTGWQGDYDHHDDDEKGECFRKYNHPMYSYRDHSIFLTGRSRYAFLFDLPNDDYKEWAKGLRKAGYATDRHYPQKLIALIERHNLHKYDMAVADAGYGKGEKTQVAIARPQYASYIVQEGDTLYSLSKRYAVSVNDLKRWNYLYDNNLAVGQELTVKTESFNK
ncbi:Flagellum-specific peptidoglycan hydrolase FlgJ [Pricia antarctica]|uniref:Peptidoglycan hydrolase n=1 Tax=Pricia antarctica TaxID=641691 RepID=A0A1G7IMX0_9FLAO|nr:glucosaminidase domain-containing protein [Pricia antarctica]SDF14041.1 Flagellum-specific peptidoglycan hydrolase FlgJ [Pricia antarctica]